ncbi:MAG: HAD-IA family hydrolase [Candidatus Binatia bacterium]
MIRFPLLLLDLDGTLLDTRLDLVGSTNHVRAIFGLPPLGVLEVERLVGRGARVLVERALGQERADAHDEGVRLFLEHYGEHCLDQTRPYPGMVDVLRALRALGARAGVVTNKPEALTRKILGGLDLLDDMVAVVGGDTFPERKPHPRGVEWVLARCDAARSQTLLVGDSPIDLATARAAGIAFCGVLWGFDPERLCAEEPELVARNADELEAIIRG